VLGAQFFELCPRFRKPTFEYIDDLVPNLGRREGDPIYEPTSAIDLIFSADDHFIGISIHGEEALRFLNLLHQIIDGHGFRSPFRSLDRRSEPHPRAEARTVRASCHLSAHQGAVSGYLSRARAAGVAWPLPEDLDDAQLEALLFPPPPAIAADQRPMPDWAWVHRALRRPNVTLALLWEEYRAGAPDGFSYSWFCDLYRLWAGRLKPTMRQTHVAGEKLIVEFVGRTGELVDGRTGEIIPVQIFVAVLGASNFTYAEAVWSRKLPN
jgi:hypothetical protein